jgi:hypothetical protein
MPYSNAPQTAGQSKTRKTAAKTYQWLFSQQLLALMLLKLLQMKVCDYAGRDDR